MKIGIIGCGLIGSRRADVARSLGDEVVVVADLDETRARLVAASGEWTTDWQRVVADPRLDAVVVATVNKSLAPIACAALDQGKHVLCEKPMGRNAAEARSVLATARRTGRALKVGFNHRHHPAIWRAHELTREGAIGDVFSIRAAYGHGGRRGYEREWRGDPELAGGGEVLDQGVHLVDLCRWFLGEITEVVGMTARWVWEISPLEDNGFALFRTHEGKVAFVHTSWTQWKNLFRFEIFGEKGYLLVEGLGGSYGTERLTQGLRAPSGPPSEKSWEHPGPDLSWEREWKEFTAAIAEGREPLGNGEDGYRAALIVDAIYESARSGKTALVEHRDAE
jgi:predicted dehydrogenase